jgi:D-serine dehydratase
VLQGGWISPDFGTLFEEDSIRLDVVTEDTASNKEHVARFARWAKKVFSQEAVLVTSQVIESEMI